VPTNTDNEPPTAIEVPSMPQNFCGRWSFRRDAHLEIDNNYSVETIEGIMSCHKNDWIVKGVEGEVYAIKNAIFEKTYDIIGEYKYQGIATPR
jgi:hypothetical protein